MRSGFGGAGGEGDEGGKHAAIRLLNDSVDEAR